MLNTQSLGKAVFVDSTSLLNLFIKETSLIIFGRSDFMHGKNNTFSSIFLVSNMEAMVSFLVLSNIFSSCLLKGVEILAKLDEIMGDWKNVDGSCSKS